MRLWCLDQSKELTCILGDKDKIKLEAEAKAWEIIPEPYQGLIESRC